MYAIRSYYGGGDEGDLEGAGRGVEAAVEHVVEVAGVGGNVARLGVGEVVHGGLAEEGGEHAAALGAVQIHSLFCRDAVEPLGKALAEDFHPEVGGFVAQQLEGLHAGGDGDRVAAERAGP